MQLSRQTRHAGFSMIEMMVVVGIIGLVAGIVFLPASGAFREITLDGDMRTLSQAHERARTAAIQHGSVSEFHIDAAQGRFWIQVPRGIGVDTVGAVYRVDPSVSFIASDTLLCYDARGYPAAGTTSTGSSCDGPDAVIVLTVSGLSDTLRINALGRSFQ